MKDKKDYVCQHPFEFSEIFSDNIYMCCPNWLPVSLGNPIDIKKSWGSDIANNIRESMLDGSYKYCVEERCPKLIGLKENRNDGLIPKDEFLKSEFMINNSVPRHIKLNFDHSCNLQCPTCRTNKIVFEGKERERTDAILQTIEEQLSEGIERIDCTGTGDPFFSSTFRKWLINFKPEKYPKLDTIHLHTNGNLWNEYNWSKMVNVQKFIKTAEISIDAATKETYDKVRIGGNWDDLQNNLKFISTLPHLKIVTLSFVVQYKNYKEMEMFYKMGDNIFKNSHIKYQVFFNRIVNWGTFDDETIKKYDVGNPNHPNYNEMVEIYNRISSKNIFHNLTI